MIYKALRVCPSLCIYTKFGTGKYTKFGTHIYKVRDTYIQSSGQKKPPVLPCVPYFIGVSRCQAPFCFSRTSPQRAIILPPGQIGGAAAPSPVCLQSSGQKKPPQCLRSHCAALRCGLRAANADARTNAAVLSLPPGAVGASDGRSIYTKFGTENRAEKMPASLAPQCAEDLPLKNEISGQIAPFPLICSYLSKNPVCVRESVFWKIPPE